MYTFNDTPCMSPIHKHKKLLLLLYRGLVSVIGMVTLLVYLGCEEPGADTVSSTVAGDSGVSTSELPVGTRVLYQVTGEALSIALSDPVIGADGRVYIATEETLYAIDAIGEGEKQIDLSEATIKAEDSTPPIFCNWEDRLCL